MSDEPVVMLCRACVVASQADDEEGVEVFMSGDDYACLHVVTDAIARAEGLDQ